MPTVAARSPIFVVFVGGSLHIIHRRVFRAVNLLQENPAMGRAGRVAGTRELVVDGTPYIVPYRVRGDAVEILRMFHARRKWPKGF